MRLTDDDLDAHRERGDERLDALVSALPPETVGQLLGALFRTDRLPEDDARFDAFMAALPEVRPEKPESIATGQALFRLFGPEILLVLGSYSLPAAYAAAHGVQVISRARRLEDDGKRRLCETAQMVINLMVEGGLEPGGIGARSARKVRLMHALVRQHVLTSKGAPWSRSHGVPINQEDLAGTLLTFSVLVLDGLAKVGARVSPSEQLGWCELWRHVGTLLGLDPRLSAANVDSALELAAQIGRRQFRPSAEGRHLARELVKVVDALFPIRGYGLSLMHFFLDDRIFGVNLATIVDLPKPNWTAALVRARAIQKRFMLDWLERLPGARRRRRWLAGSFAQQLILLQRPDKLSPFEVPPSLLRHWQLARSKP